MEFKLILQARKLILVAELTSQAFLLHLRNHQHYLVRFESKIIFFQNGILKLKNPTFLLLVSANSWILERRLILTNM